MEITSNAEQELANLGKALALYQVASKKTATETLWRKAYDLRIQLFKGYRAQQWRGTRKGAQQFTGIAFTELRRRARSGGGITLRQGLRPSDKAPGTYFQRRKLTGKAGSSRRLRVPVKMSDYSKLVWSELARRQSGIGVLSVSFLMRRWNAKRSELVRNSTRLGQLGNVAVDSFEQKDRRGATLGRVQLGTESVRLTGFTGGLSKIDSRYGVSSRAFAAVTADIVPYLQRKLGPDFREVMRANGIAA